ncbi:MAG: SHOCT domain-containing protein [Clostridia bacterium]|nr:SHOCT domain-containing protein [Clostridia bacterium]
MNRYRYRFIADDRAQKVYISTGIDVDILDEIPYEKIIGFEVIEDSQVVGGIKRAIVGGVLAGVAGAIVGSQTAHKKAVSSMKAVIYCENIRKPQYTLEFITTETKTTDIDYISAKRFTDNINATLKAVIAKANQTIRPTQRQVLVASATHQSSNEVMESLKKLKTAYDYNLITEAEYEGKKRELLKRL